MRLEDYLALHACQSPQKIAVFSGGEECTYAEFYQRVQQRAAEIKDSFGTSESHSFRLEKTAIPFRSSQSIDFLVEYLERRRPRDHVHRLQQRRRTDDGPRPGRRTDGQGVLRLSGRSAYRSERAGRLIRNRQTEEETKRERLKLQALSFGFRRKRTAVFYSSPRIGSIRP